METIQQIPGLAVQVSAATIKALTEPVKDAKRAITLVFKNGTSDSTIQFVSLKVLDGTITETPGPEKIFGRNEDFIIKAQETGNVRPVVKQWYTIKYRGRTQSGLSGSQGQSIEIKLRYVIGRRFWTRYFSI